MSQPPDHYRILGLTPAADAAQIRQAYRALAKQYHPDRVPAERRAWALEQMAAVNAAYAALRDPQRRAVYDRRHGDAQQADLTADALWLRSRARERWRRQQAARWRTTGRVCLILFAASLLLTTLVARQPKYLLIAALLDGALLGLLILSLLRANR